MLTRLKFPHLIFALFSMPTVLFHPTCAARTDRHRHRAHEPVTFLGHGHGQSVTSSMTALCRPQVSYYVGWMNVRCGRPIHHPLPLLHTCSHFLYLDGLGKRRVEGLPGRALNANEFKRRPGPPVSVRLSDEQALKTSIMLITWLGLCLPPDQARTHDPLSRHASM